MKRFLSQNVFVLFIRLAMFNLKEAYYLSNNLGAANLFNTQVKFEAYLTIKYHSIEKGLALPSPRIGFGEKKVYELIDLTVEYFSKFKNKAFLREQINILDSYFDFQTKNNHTNNDLINKFNNLKRIVSIDDYEKCGILTMSKNEVLDTTDINFDKFVSSRYSVRDFSSEPVSRLIINQALKIAKKTPSACNRQPWHVYVYNGERKKGLLKWQGGTPGFSDSIDTALLITCDYNGYFIHEKYQPYVDGGLYAMTLMYAFHSLGIGTIPLTTAKKINDLDFLYKKELIPSNQVPILIIGIGHLKEEFNVALSNRIPVDRYVEYVS